MSGERLLLDTNAVIALLRGEQKVRELCSSSSWVGISIVCEIEFLCFRGLLSQDRELFYQMRGRIDRIGIDSGDDELISRAIELRTTSKLKLPDALIAATALTRSAKLVTTDTAFRGAVETIDF